jgi:hypothetical protein
LDYLAQLFAGARISPIRVGMVNLHQFLEPRLDLDTRSLAGEIERLQTLFLKRF